MYTHNHEPKKERIYHEFNRGGERLSMSLLLTQALLYQFNNFAIMPFVFDYCQNLGYSPLIAGVIFALTPLGTATLSIL